MKEVKAIDIDIAVPTDFTAELKEEYQNYVSNKIPSPQPLTLPPVFTPVLSGRIDRPQPPHLKKLVSSATSVLTDAQMASTPDEITESPLNRLRSHSKSSSQSSLPR